MAGKNNKNGLVELFRFLISIWVAYFHGFFPILSDKFNGVNTSVDFFFVISGFFFMKSMEKYKETPILKVIPHIFWDRTKRFIVPLIIAALSILYCNIMFKFEFNGFNWPFSFLWFFAAQFVFLSLFYVLIRKAKGKLVLNICCGIVVCVFMSMCLVLTRELDRPARGPAMVAIGILLSQIPRLEIKGKDSKKAERLTLLVNAIGCALSFAAFLYLAYLPGYEIWKLHLLGCLVGPALLYFAVALPVRSRFLNFLGECSVFVYLAQCPILLHHYHVSRDTKDQFPLFCVCIIAMFLLNRLVNRKKAANKISATTTLQ
jgi:peptidoglycan/LPS O-acetylase OafA/YrhL